MKKIMNLLLILFLLFIHCDKPANSWILSSPDRSIQIQIETRSAGNISDNSISYKVFKIENQTKNIVLEQSRLGIRMQSRNYLNELVYISQEKSRINESYEMVAGKRLKNINHGNQLKLKFKNQKGHPVQFIFRAYNDGIAFRYLFPDTANKMFTIKEELSSFNLPEDGQCWIQPYDTIGTWSPAYEYGYLKDMPVGQEPPMTTGWGFPALFHINDSWILLTESDLNRGYCGSHLAAEAPDGEYRIEFPHAWEAYGKWDSYPSSKLPWKTPWRVAIIGNKLETIVESKLVSHLAEPNRIEQTDWIKPGKASWSWWGDHTSGKNFKKLKNYVDFAAEMGWRYSLVDADWHIMEGGTIQELVKYANQKNVGILLWYNSGGPHTKVMNAGPRDKMYDPVIRKKEMEKIRNWGIQGIKVDFFQSGKQEVINLYLDILQDAAKHKLVVNFHGCTIPRGWQRTYPNLLTLEAVRGAELYGYHKFPPRAVWLNNIYPYTRNVLGSMDYTPVTFSDYKPESGHITSYAHELALSVIFESGIMHLADRIEGYKSVPPGVLDFLKKVPVAWDEIFFLKGFPAKLTVIARQKGKEYYIAGINGEMREKFIDIKYDFLDPGKYEIEMWLDGSNSRSFKYEQKTINAGTKDRLKLIKAGGFAGRLVPINQSID